MAGTERRSLHGIQLHTDDAQELAGAHSTGAPAINPEGLSSHGPDPSRSHPVQHLKGREGKLRSAKTTLA